ncbi:MAG: proline racemase family protein [Bifidobacteriaceae bacterium]|jgi:proline racemase|nr:proline racemase family protein [Bifidobacteriaceae bacterium]
MPVQDQADGVVSDAGPALGGARPAAGLPPGGAVSDAGPALGGARPAAGFAPGGVVSDGASPVGGARPAAGLPPGGALIGAGWAAGREAHLGAGGLGGAPGQASGSQAGLGGLAAGARIEFTDYHTAGEPFRIVGGPQAGLPEPPGASVLERRTWISRHLDGARRLLVNEPRGHADMYGGWIVPPDGPDAAGRDAAFGVVFFHKDGYSTACGHGSIALGAWALDTGLVPSAPDAVAEFALDVPSGRVWVAGRREGGRVVAVRFRNVPAWVAARSVPVETSLGPIRVDISYGGAFYASARAADLGLQVAPGCLGELIAVGREIKWALNQHPAVAHPEDPRLSGMYGTIWWQDEPPAPAPAPAQPGGPAPAPAPAQPGGPVPGPAPAQPGGPAPAGGAAWQGDPASAGGAAWPGDPASAGGAAWPGDPASAGGAAWPGGPAPAPAPAQPGGIGPAGGAAWPGGIGPAGGAAQGDVSAAGPAAPPDGIGPVLGLAQRNVTVFADGEVDRSPCGSGTSARLALLAADGLVGPGRDLEHWSIIGTRFTGRVLGPGPDQPVAGRRVGTVLTEVEGRASHTASGYAVLTPGDETALGFQLR